MHASKNDAQSLTPHTTEFFAPVWRVMRDANVTANEVAEQVGYRSGAADMNQLRSLTVAGESTWVLRTQTSRSWHEFI